jgi:hypothetical protein
MKKFLLLAIITWNAFSLMAQQTRLFSYDREKIDAIMEQINETTVPVGSMSPFIGDATALNSTGKWSFYLLGAIPGCTLPVAGTLISMMIGTTAFGQWSGIIIGGIVGLVAPPLITSMVTKDPEKTRFAVFGSLTGGAIGILGFGYFAAKIGGWI